VSNSEFRAIFYGPSRGGVPPARLPFVITARVTKIAESPLRIFNRLPELRLRSCFFILPLSLDSDASGLFIESVFEPGPNRHHSPIGSRHSFCKRCFLYADQSQLDGFHGQCRGNRLQC
jgi:hypothetical protein